jgi:hypothetical protein
MPYTKRKHSIKLRYFIWTGMANFLLKHSLRQENINLFGYIHSKINYKETVPTI